MNLQRAFDIILLGATGFTGSLAAKYLAKNAPLGVRWAISGQNPKKVEKLFQELVSFCDKASGLNPPLKFLIVNHLQRDEVFAAVTRTRVALNFAGPFARWGENVVAACAELGTHYFDITGETLWVHKMIERYEAKAKESGAVLVPFSGFDSVPSDLGVWEVQKLAQARLAQEEKEGGVHRSITKIVSLFSARGGLNGGTLETFLDMLEKSEASSDQLKDPFLLVPKGQKKDFAFKESPWPVYIKEAHLTAPPFFMAQVNSRVVYRSQALRAGSSIPPYEYLELQKIPSSFSCWTAWTIALLSQGVSQVGKFGAGRKLMRVLGPKSGEGPSAEVQRSGFFRVRFLAYSDLELLAETAFSFQGDPGNQATVTLICQSALCLLLDEPKLPSGGFWTPSTAFGEALLARLNLKVSQ